VESVECFQLTAKKKKEKGEEAVGTRGTAAEQSTACDWGGREQGRERNLNRGTLKGRNCDRDVMAGWAKTLERSVFGLCLSHASQ